MHGRPSAVPETTLGEQAPVELLCELVIDSVHELHKQAEARLAAKRAARAEAREIRMKELERQQKEIYQVQKKYYGLDTKWGDIEQWMEDSERYSRRARRNASASDEDERMSVGSRGSLRSHVEYASAYPVAGLENERTKWKNYSKATNGYEEDVYGSSQNRKSSRASYYPDLGLHNSGYASTSQPSSQNGNWPSLLYSDALPARSYRASVYDESVYSGSRRYSASSSRAPSEYSCYLGSGSRASSRASSARASPVIEERPEKDFEKGARTVSSLSAATLASLGGTSSRRGSGDTSISVDTEASIREIKDSLAEVEEKYKKAMVSNAQLDNEKTNFMYQVDTLKDALLELEEQLAESRRQYEEKSKEFEREKHAHSILQFQFKEIKEALKQRDEMLAEIQQLQQKQQSYVREISDLQETIEWKDKKIGALERQKDFFDSIRSERDDLRDEVMMLKEQLKKHGIIPDSDIATNGDASDVLDNEGHLDSSKAVPGTPQALKTAGDGMLGKAKEVDMKNEIVEDVGKREILQNSEHEEHKEESEEQEVQTLHADENTRAENLIEEPDALSTVMLPDSRFCKALDQFCKPVSGNACSSDDSDADDLRKETQSADTAARQPVSKEVEQSNLNPRTAENSEMGSLQGQDFESPQEMHGELNAEHELEKAALQQEEGEDVEASCALSANEAEQAADSAGDSSEVVSDQSGLPELVDSQSEVVNVERCAETLQCSGESAGSKVTEVLEKTLVESKDCTDGTANETGGDRAGEQNEVGSAVQGEKMERDSTGSEGEESCGSCAPSDPNEEGDDQAQIQPVSSEDSEEALLEEQNMQEQTELKPAEKGGQEEVLTGNLEEYSDCAEKQEKASGESAGSANEAEVSALHQTEPDTDTVKEMVSQETSLDPVISDDETEETEMQTGVMSGKGEENRIEYLEHDRTEDLKSKAELQMVQCSKETTGDSEDEKNISLESEAQNVVKQGESKEEFVACHSVTSENQVDKETFKEDTKQSELADQQGDGFTSMEGTDNSLAQKAELDGSVSEQLRLEGQAEEEQEDEGDAFDFDEDSEQILETDEKRDGGESDAQSEEDDGTSSMIRKAAPTGEAGERTGKIKTSDTLTKDDGLQHKEGNESEEAGHSQEEASALKTDEKADVSAEGNEASDSNEVEKAPGDSGLEQDLESAGCNRAESKEDLRGGRKGKGKSRDDCTVS
ncbi:leucine-rich repeat flightless-interacting protein 1 isoform X9 [Coturnix japonica]|uniref:leucine-rich repeat flightless-interacting protein 1 isoform X9 n=1 Tax=Coturnix japonica TaxID=93934 RepID=UPI0007773490|nr:leucine-rich repeat flightless-interacting protein 1 isoform X9 [Coturnix japonica]